ncbi:hypothetical protein MMC30_000737 [Trapelia coarctata]|nr:hypothetical protein [Trapelia coarctata]
MIFEELLHLLPKLRSLTTWMIGPEVGAKLPDDVKTPKPIPLGCCPVCTRNGRSRICRIVGGSYHDFFDSKNWTRPDLAVMFHRGHMQDYEEDFAPTVKLLVTQNITTMCTTYNKQEMLEDTENFRKLGANFISEGAVNPWRSMIKRLDHLDHEPYVIWYMYYYWYIIGQIHVDEDLIEEVD